MELDRMKEKVMDEEDEEEEEQEEQGGEEEEEEEEACLCVRGAGGRKGWLWSALAAEWNKFCRHLIYSLPFTAFADAEHTHAPRQAFSSSHCRRAAQT